MSVEYDRFKFPRSSGAPYRALLESGQRTRPAGKYNADSDESRITQTGRAMNCTTTNQHHVPGANGIRRDSEIAHTGRGGIPMGTLSHPLDRTNL